MEKTGAEKNLVGKLPRGQKIMMEKTEVERPEGRPGGRKKVGKDRGRNDLAPIVHHIDR